MKSRPHSSHASATTVIEIEAAFRRLCPDPDCRSVAIKHALQELASTLESVLSRFGRTPTSEPLLLALLPSLLAEARRIDLLDRLLLAIEQLQLGHQVDLLPLVQAAIADLAAQPAEDQL